MSGSSLVHQTIHVQTGMHDGLQTMPSLNWEPLTIDTLLLEAGLTVEQKKRKVKEIYGNVRWKEADVYEANKVRKIIRNHIF